MMMMCSRTFSVAFLLAFVMKEFVIGKETHRGERESFPGMNRNKTKKLSLAAFKDILFTALSSNALAIKQSGRKQDNGHNSNIADQITWDHMIDHGWKLSEIRSRNGRNDLEGRELRAKNETDDNLKSPFLVCSRSERFKSGFQRLNHMLKHVGSSSADTVVISNNSRQSCYHMTMTFANAHIVGTSDDLGNEYSIIPLTDLMKVSHDTIDIISEGPNDRGPELEVDQLIHVDLVAGLRKMTDAMVIAKANEILQDLKSKAKNGTNQGRRQLRKDRSQEEKFLRYNKSIKTSKEETKFSAFEEETAMSISDVFSMTSNIAANSRRNQGLHRRDEFWSRCLNNGIEAEHSCKNMFDNITIRLQYNNNGFSIVLKSSRNDTHHEEINSSASNADCILSLIIGLSANPNVLSIEAEAPIVPHDYESQWITQSSVVGDRPFFDVGLTGSGQIISLSDSGIDIDHPYFGPSNNNIYDGNWDFSQRKVVKYNHNKSGDNYEPSGGHGTRVAGVIAGKIAGASDSAADGIAKDAKLHVWDLQIGKGGYSDPGPRAWFSSFYNQKDGAKISNGSWGSKYKAYSFRCRFYDEALYGQYSDILFVASAGNEGNDIPGQPMNTIGDPASCKNVLAVGASQSYGDRIHGEDEGRDYLTEFSSRGPTMDGRTKPDLVAPGYTILTARAHPPEGSDSIWQTFGTSFSSPVAAGSAALVRQYFEEGWYPCGSKGCGKKINPSGTLVKAVLMNSGRSLKQVQRVPNGPILENIEFYDNNQGMGLIQMKDSLPLKTKNDFNVIAVNNYTILDGRRRDIFIKANDSKCSSLELSVTLAWYDAPGAAGCAECLMNDLDLNVLEVNTNGKVKGKWIYPNGMRRRDTKNNVERIRTIISAGTLYRISVKARNLSEADAKFSLVATGCFKRQWWLERKMKKARGD